jgi:hypothetical protein
VREYDGFLLDDPIWPGSPIERMDRPRYYRCGCGVASRREDFLPMLKASGKDEYGRLECPFCFGPGFFSGGGFVIMALPIEI